jgi:hypothetical protein
MTQILTPKKLSVSVDKAFREAGVSEALRGVELAKIGRSIEISSPRTLQWTNDPSERDYFAFKPPPGSVNIFWGPHGSKLIDALESAHLQKDVRALELLSSQAVNAWRRRKLKSISSAAKLAKDAPVLFDIRYRGKTLAESLWSPGEGCGTLTLPYTGGQVNLKEFSVVNYVLNPARAKLPEVLIVIAPPQLSSLEKEALRAVPEIYSESHIGERVVACTVLATVVVFVALVTIVTTCCQAFHDKLAEVELDRKTLKKLGARPSIAKLLEARARIFEEFNVR